MRYKVWAGSVEVEFESNTKARFHWVEKTLVYDSCGDVVEGEEAEGILADPVVELENKTAGTFECRVPYKLETRFGTVTNPYYDFFTVGQTWVMVEEDTECVFFGRVNGIKDLFDLDREISADGILNELERMQTRLDAGSYATTGTFPSSILDRVMRPDKADKDLSPVNCMERGNVTFESKNISTEDSGDQFGSYWNILTTYLLEHEKGKDGYLRLRLANEPGTEKYFFYYDYLKDEDLPRTKQAIEYGVNMQDMTFEEKRTSELVNCVTAHGTETVKKGWFIFKKTTYNVITGTAKDELSIAKYGLNSRHIYVDGKTSTEESLTEAAKEEMKNYKQTLEPTLTIDAFDRTDRGENIEKLGFLRMTHILSKPHGINRWMACTKVKLPLDAPDSKQFTFGLTSKKLSRKMRSLTNMMKKVHDIASGLVGHVNEISETS